MPNYVRNIITIGANVPEETLDRIYEKVLGVIGETWEQTSPFVASVHKGKIPSEGLRFDFNNLLPMPESLNMDCGTVSDKGDLLFSIYRNLPSIVFLAIGGAGSPEELFVGVNPFEIEKEYDLLASLLERARTEEVLGDDGTAASIPSSLLDEYSKDLKTLKDDAICYLQCGTWPKSSFHLLPDYLKSFESRVGTEWIKQEIQDKGGCPGSIIDLMAYLNSPAQKKAIEMGRTRAENISKYGHADWYDWCCDVWGTKWNAGKFTIDWDFRTMSFDTAWSRPYGIINAFIEAFPDVDFEWLYADEDCGYNTGRICASDNGIAIDEYESVSNEAYEAYVRCWGTSSCMYQDEDGNWAQYDCDDCPHPC